MKIRFSLTSAQCVATQDCATLGYTETSCSGGSGVKCPFGNKWACFKSESEICNDLGFTLTCTGTNQTGGGGKACNGKYNYCSCTDGYVWQNGACKQSTPDYSDCAIGALFYSDNTCSDKLESSKTLLGVVIYEKSASKNGWIMTVKPIKTTIAWSTEKVGVTGLTQYNSTPTDAQASCTNTDKITAQGNSSTYPAAWAAKNYTEGGKTWCLPSGGLLNTALNNSTNFAKVNAGITTAGGTILGNVYNGYERVWSSSQHSQTKAWLFLATINSPDHMDYTSKRDYNNFYGNSSVRAVMSF